jgi:hypothetical protein
MALPSTPQVNPLSKTITQNVAKKTSKKTKKTKETMPVGSGNLFDIELEATGGKTTSLSTTTGMGSVDDLSGIFSFSGFNQTSSNAVPPSSLFDTSFESFDTYWS